MLLNVHSRPETLGSFMPALVAQSLPPFLVIYGVANYIFLNELRGSNLVGLISIFVPLIYMLLPLKLLAKKLVSEVKRSDSKQYQLYMLDFNIDYDRANPVTDEEATLNYLKKIEREANIKKLNKIRRATQRFARESFAQYVQAGSMKDRGALYINHRATTNRASYNVGCLALTFRFPIMKSAVCLRFYAIMYTQATTVLKKVQVKW